EYINRAVKLKADYIQTPEMTSIIAQNRNTLFSQIETDDGTTNYNRVIGFAANLAKQHGIWLHLGSMAVKLSDSKAANRALLFSPDGRRIATYDKLHMFDVDLPNNESWRESSVYQAGERAILCRTEKFNLGLSICYDLRFPGLYRQLAQAGAQILTCPAAFTRQTGKAHWHSLLRARAIENGAFVIAAAQGGQHQDGRETFGHSLIINPWGEIIAEINHDRPDIIVCDIDLGQVEKARSRIPSLSNIQNYETVEINCE
ncbi:MAG: carbon-nitrogen hydrolase family protein, partial [Hyphomicrobiales bacterium]|nr:carbon-nitrogen hydrolase family protein [Hyphomicrobiales bacterium]